MKFAIFLLLLSGCITTHVPEHIHTSVATKKEVAIFANAQNTAINEIVVGLEEKISNLESKIDSCQMRSNSDSRILHIDLGQGSDKPSPSFIVVVKGDTFGKIANRFGVSLKYIIKLNSIFDFGKVDMFIDEYRGKQNWDPDYLEIGDQIIIP